MTLSAVINFTRVKKLTRVTTRQPSLEVSSRTDVNEAIDGRKNKAHPSSDTATAISVTVATVSFHVSSHGLLYGY